MEEATRSRRPAKSGPGGRARALGEPDSQASKAKKSLYIVATNDLDEDKLSAEEMLEGYKRQVHVELGFRFFKDPRVKASTFFLESERRILALLMVMTLCLLVYSALERRIRKGLQAQDPAFPDQEGNPTPRPTARGVFESFLGIHVLFTGKSRLVLNMKKGYQIISTVLGTRYDRLYASPPR